MIGELLDGKYEIVRLIGEGGMGAVYCARHASTGREVAVKVISSEAIARDEVLVARFEREAQAAAKVLSPHIVEILDAGHDSKSGHPYMVMEILSGESVHQLFKRLGPLPPALAVRIAVQTCMGLEKAHGAGVVHRDIKPANLFMTEADGDGRIVKLLDFGVAKFKMDQATDTDNQSLTRTGSMLGSPMYMSPEQARGLKTIDHRADVWSLGVVLYQLLSGRTPHQDIDGLGELIITICSEEPERMSEHAPWVHPNLVDVVHGALKLAPDKRFQSAAEFRVALEQSLDSDWHIHKSMAVALTEEEKAARPEADDPPPSSNAATVALENVDQLIADAQAKAAASKSVALDDVQATVALSADEMGLDQVLLDKLEASDKPKSEENKPAEASVQINEGRFDKTVPSVRARDLATRATATKKHEEAEEPGSGRLVGAVLVGLAIAGAGLYVYTTQLDKAQAEKRQADKAQADKPAATAKAQETPSSSTSTPTPLTSAETGDDVDDAKDAGSDDDATATQKVQVRITPAFASVSVAGEVRKPDNGFIEIEGAIGSVHNVVLTVAGKRKQASVTITEDGPVPASIVHAGGPIQRPPPPRDPYDE